jgi:AcrR family transcriptional regulator
MNESIGRLPQQNRSRVTTHQFLAAAQKLLETQTFAELSLTDLAEKAERSVGTFYQRFGSKDELLKVLIRDFLESGVNQPSPEWSGKTEKDIFTSFLGDSYFRIRKNRNLWHAALELSSSDPKFWADFAGLRWRRLDLLVDALEKCRGRKKKMSPEEVRRFAIAVQVFNSVINNQIINSPGPLSLEDDAFLPTMVEIAWNVAQGTYA